MKKFVVILAIVVMAALFLNEAQTASAAMRNLLSEFQIAMYAGDLDKINSLIKDGLQVNDTLEMVYDLAMAKSVSPGKVSVSEDFLVSLIKRLAKAKANFKDKDVFDQTSTYDLTYLNYNLLVAFLDAGINPDVIPLSRKYWDKKEYHSPLFYCLSSEGYSKTIKLLVEHGASLSYGMYGFRTHAMAFFLEHRDLEYTSSLTENNLKYITEVVEILRKAGADKSDAKKYLEKCREKHRNVPDALKYLDKIEDAVNGSWFDWF